MDDNETGCLLVGKSSKSGNVTGIEYTENVSEK